MKLKPFQTPAPKPADLDVPLETVQALVARQRFQAVTESLDPFTRMACEHPEACACDTDYPGWAEQIAALAAAHKRPQEA